MTLGDKLTRLRKEQNYTQEQLAELLGVSRQSVSKWESDAAYPETEKLIRLSTLFDCSLDYLLRDALREPAAQQKARQGVSLRFPGYERKSVRLVHGIPLYHVNIGPGRVAHGIFAVGLVARGVVAVGLASLGVISIGLVSVGLLALGTLAFGIVAAGSIAAGILAFGAISVGVFSCGAMAIGAFSVGAMARGTHAALGDYAQAPVALGKTEAIGELFQRLTLLSPQEQVQVQQILEEITPFWLRWAAALFQLFL